MKEIEIQALAAAAFILIFSGPLYAAPSGNFTGTFKGLFVVGPNSCNYEVGSEESGTIIVRRLLRNHGMANLRLTGARVPLSGKASFNRSGTALSISNRATASRLIERKSSSSSAHFSYRGRLLLVENYDRCRIQLHGTLAQVSATPAPIEIEKQP